MDADTKEVLAALAEILQTEITRSLASDNSMVALARAILESDSSLAHKYEQHWNNVAFLDRESISQQTAGSLKQLDELIHRLKE